MSDPLAERIYQAAFDRHVLIDRTDCAALAAAAREHIADEIAARSGAEKARYPGWDSHSSGYLYALDIAEQIARGDTE
jgi:3-oxoacyl-[acyl-carrier-protein] synthase III